MSGAGSSSWPTARGEDSESCGNHPGAKDSLTGATRAWPTPQAHDIQERGNTEADHHHYPHDLANASAFWPTPSSQGSAGETSEDLERKGAKLVNRKTGRVLQTNLATEVKAWPTPRAITGGGESADRKQELGREDSGGGDLQAACQNWASSPQGREISRLGSESSKSAPNSRRRLNPLFVEWLMGLPRGWTDFAPLGTASSPSRPPSPSSRSPESCFKDWLRMSRLLMVEILLRPEDADAPRPEGEVVREIPKRGIPPKVKVDKDLGPLFK